MRIAVLLVVGVLGVIPETFTPQEKQLALEELSKNLFKSRIEYLGEEKGLGVIATEDIQTGDLIAQEKELLAPVSFEDFEWSAYFEKEPGIVFVVARMIYERLVNTKEAKSNLWAHIPSSTIETVHNWTEPELEYFNSLFAFNAESFQTEFESSMNTYFEIIRNIPGVNETCPICLTKEAWIWGYATAESRMFGMSKYSWRLINNHPYLEEDQNTLGYVFLPSIELLNHMPVPPNLRNQNKRTGMIYSPIRSATLYAQRNFRKGQEVFWQYNEISNIKLLVQHGFVLEHNVDDILITAVSKFSDCPPNLQNLVSAKECVFTSKVFELDQTLLKYILLNSGGVRIDGELNFEEFFERSPKFREVLLSALTAYRLVHVNKSATKCLGDYSTIKERLNKHSYQNHRYKTIDKLCISSFWSFFQHLKLTERTMLKSYFKVLFLS